MTEKNIAGLTKERSLIERLRDHCSAGPQCRCTFNLAAEEIERLQAALSWSEQRRWNTKMAMEVVVYAIAGDDQAQLIRAYESRLQELRNPKPPTADELWACGLCGWSGSLLPAKHAPDCPNGKALGPFKPTAVEPTPP